jgi:nucleoside-diphosphate-sugar epimerase
VSKPRILIVGADNFIGSRVMEALTAAGGATPVVDELKDIQGIVNAAVGSPATIRAQSLKVEAIVRASCPQARLVHLSSMTVYGSLDGQVDETAALVADLGDYAAAQIEAERIVNALPNTVTLRLGCEYGPACPQWSGRIAQLLLAHRLGDLGAAGDGCCNLLFIDDLVDAVLAGLQTPAIQGETFNLAMPSPPTWNEYFTRFGIALHAVPIRRITSRRLAFESKLLAVPLKGWELVARMSGLARTAAIPAITPSLLKLCRQQISMNVAKAESRLNMRWTPLDEGMQRAAAWMLAAR